MNAVAELAIQKLAELADEISEFFVGLIVGLAVIFMLPGMLRGGVTSFLVILLFSHP